MDDRRRRHVSRTVPIGDLPPLWATPKKSRRSVVVLAPIGAAPTDNSANIVPSPVVSQRHSVRLPPIPKNISSVPNDLDILDSHSSNPSYLHNSLECLNSSANYPPDGAMVSPRDGGYMVPDFDAYRKPPRRRCGIIEPVYEQMAPPCSKSQHYNNCIVENREKAPNSSTAPSINGFADEKESKRLNKEMMMLSEKLQQANAQFYPHSYIPNSALPDIPLPRAVFDKRSALPPIGDRPSRFEQPQPKVIVTQSWQPETSYDIYFMAKHSIEGLSALTASTSSVKTCVSSPSTPEAAGGGRAHPGPLLEEEEVDLRPYSQKRREIRDKVLHRFLANRGQSRRRNAVTAEVDNLDRGILVSYWREQALLRGLQTCF